MRQAVFRFFVAGHLVDHVPHQIAVDIQVLHLLARLVVRDEICRTVHFAFEMRQLLFDAGGVGVTRYSELLFAREFAVGAMETRQNFWL